MADFFSCGKEIRFRGFDTGKKRFWDLKTDERTENEFNMSELNTWNQILLFKNEQMLYCEYSDLIPPSWTVFCCIKCFIASSGCADPYPSAVAIHIAVLCSSVKLHFKMLFCVVLKITCRWLCFCHFSMPTCEKTPHIFSIIKMDKCILTGSEVMCLLYFLWKFFVAVLCSTTSQLVEVVSPVMYWRKLQNIYKVGEYPENISRGLECLTAFTNQSTIIASSYRANTQELAYCAKFLRWQI